MTVLIYIFLILEITFAEEPNHLEVSYNNEAATDGLLIQTQEIKYLNNRRNLTWNYYGVREEANDFGFEYINKAGINTHSFSGNSFGMTLGKKIDFNSYLSLKLGLHNLQAQTNTQILYSKLSTVHLFGGFELITLLQNDFFYAQAPSITPIKNSLRAQTLKINFNYSSKEYIRIPITLENTKISDDNNFKKIQTSFKLGKAYPTWIWLAFNMENIAYERNQSGYWSPESFVSYGV